MFQGGINTQFGILAIPTVVLFHNTRQVTKFNQTEYLIDKFADFVEATTFLGLLFWLVKKTIFSNVLNDE